MTVIYAHVIHSLRRATAQRQPTPTQLEELATAFTQQVQQLSSELATTDRRLTDLSERLATTDQGDRLTDALSPIRATLQEHSSALETLAALPARLSELERSISSLTSAPSHKPRLSVVTGDTHRRSVSVPKPVGSDQLTDHETTDKGAFVRRCLTDNPTMRVADIQRRATSQGLKIAHSYISDLRKAFLAEQGKKAQQETA